MIGLLQDVRWTISTLRKIRHMLNTTTYERDNDE